MSSSKRKYGWLATFMAGGMATASSRAGWGVKPPVPIGPKPEEPRDSTVGGGNVAILVGLLLMPCVIGAGLATDPSVTLRGSARAVAASAHMPFTAVRQAAAHPL